MKSKILKTICFIGLFVPVTSISFAQIANNYPHDSLIQTDPNVVFTEMFEETTISSMITAGGYVPPSSVTLPNFSFTSSVPIGSLGIQSGKFTTYQTPATSNATELLKRFSTGISDSVFVRYYIKYNNSHTFHHSGIWLGGTDPALPCWPCNYPGRSTPPSGDSSFVVGSEIRGNSNQIPATNQPFGLYNYWMGMRPQISGQYYGNEFISPNSNATIDITQWNCIEVMLRLNNPITESSGELKLWINGVLIADYGKGFPNGTWNNSFFNEGTGSPFEGFRWRKTSPLKFNYIWIKNYSTNNASYPSANNVLYDHIVVAKNYIGPIYVPITTGITDMSETNAINLYPNPATKQLSFSKTLNDIEVVNIYGQTVMTKIKSAKSISVQELPDGIYFIRTDNAAMKFIVSH